MSSSIISSSSANLQSAKPAWNDVFKNPVDNDDNLWTEYLLEAAKFDEHIIEEWTKVVDVILVYVALFTAVLTAFVISTASQFTRDPATISNDLLVAMYQQLVAISNNSTAQVVDMNLLLHQPPTGLNHAIFSNALVFASLSISIVVSSTALTAKLWLVTYSNRVNALAGTPYERAVRRQRAYDGLLKWKMGVVIDSLPLMVLVSVVLFGIFVHQSIGADQAIIGYVVGIMLLVGLAFLLVGSFCGAFIPDCPYDSAFSYFVKQGFRLFPDIRAPTWMGTRLSKMEPSLGRVVGITLVSAGVAATTYILVSRISPAFLILFCYPIAGVFALMRRPEERNRRPHFYELQTLVLCATISVAVTMSISSFYIGGAKQKLFVIFFWISCSLLLGLGIHGIRMSGSISDTAEADAIAWLLKSTSSWTPDYFEKAGQIAGHSKVQLDATKALLLKSLLPLLSSLIMSRKNDTRNEEIYVACLAQLASFKDEKGSFWDNNDAITHPSLPQTLEDRLREIKASSQKTHVIHAAAASALQSFGIKEKEAPDEAVV